MAILATWERMTRIKAPIRNAAGGHGRSWSVFDFHGPIACGENVVFAEGVELSTDCVSAFVAGASGNLTRGVIETAVNSRLWRCKGVGGDRGRPLMACH
jgi:hypothetical protein